MSWQWAVLVSLLYKVWSGIKANSNSDKSGLLIPIKMGDIFLPWSLLCASC